MAQPCPHPEQPVSDPAPVEPRLILAPPQRNGGAAAPINPAQQDGGAAAPVRKPSGRIHYRRIWLNRPGHHGSAHIISEVQIERLKDGVSIDASFLISDCTRNVTIDCDIWQNASAAERHNSVRKARLVRDAAAAFCAALESAVAEYEAERVARRRPRKKKQS